MKINKLEKELNKLESKLEDMPWSFRRIFLGANIKKPGIGFIGQYNFGHPQSDTDYVSREEALQACQDMIKYLKGE